MANKTAQEWLEQWVHGNLDAPGHVDRKSTMRDLAAVCAQDGTAAGYSIADIKAAADGDLETYLVRQQNALTERKPS
jgi:hypothetical protein